MIYNKEINQTNINSAQIYWKILRREPDYIILHVETNNATNLTAR